MNTNVIIGILVALAVGAGLWLTFGSNKAEAPTDGAKTESTGAQVESNSNVNVDESFAGNGSFLDLMGLGKNLKCDFNYVADDTDGSVSGIVFVSGDRLRGDFEMQQDGQVYMSHMIQANDTIYTWSETPDGTFAVKMPIDQTTEDADLDDDSAVTGRPVDLDNEVEYDCRAWSISNAVFVPPSNIEFQDMHQMMNAMMQGFDPAQFSQ